MSKTNHCKSMALSNLIRCCSPGHGGHFLLRLRLGVFSAASLTPALIPGTNASSGAIGTNTADERKSTCMPSEVSVLQTLPRVRWHKPVFTDHNFTVWSRDAVSSTFWSCERTAEVTQ